MDTILLFAGYRHLYFTGLSSGVYPVEWIFFKILILESPINTGFCQKRNRITPCNVLPSCYSISSRRRDKIFHTCWFAPTAF